MRTEIQGYVTESMSEESGGERSFEGRSAKANVTEGKKKPTEAS